MQAIPDYYVDIQNDTALLQRLELRGVDIADRWQPIAELAQTRVDNHASPFTSAHAALALAAAGRFQEADELIKLMKAFVAEGDASLGPRYAMAVLPASEAALAHPKGEHQRVLDILMPARRDLWLMGGSHAQRDLFFQLLIDSAVKLEREGGGPATTAPFQAITCLNSCLEHQIRRCRCGTSNLAKATFIEYLG